MWKDEIAKGEPRALKAMEASVVSAGQKQKVMSVAWEEESIYNDTYNHEANCKTSMPRSWPHVGKVSE